MATKFPIPPFPPDPQAPQTRYYYAYRVTCHHPASPEKYYYGCRSSRVPPEADTDYWSRSHFLAAARTRYGPEWFTKKVVSVHRNREEALAKEIKLHAHFDVKNHPRFFNRANQTSTKFTTAGAPSAATREKISATMKRNLVGVGRHASEATRAKLRSVRGTFAPFAGRAHRPETKAKIAATLQGRPNDANRGSRHSAATKAKIAAGMRAHHAARQATSQAARAAQRSAAAVPVPPGAAGTATAIDIF